MSLFQILVFVALMANWSVGEEVASCTDLVKSKERREHSECIHDYMGRIQSNSLYRDVGSVIQFAIGRGIYPPSNPIEFPPITPTSDTWANLGNRFEDLFCIILELIRRCSSNVKQCPLSEVASYNSGTPDGLRKDAQPVLDALFEPNGINLNLGVHCKGRLANLDQELMMELINLIDEQVDCQGSAVDEYRSCVTRELQALDRETNITSRLQMAFWSARFQQPLQLNSDKKHQLRSELASLYCRHKEINERCAALHGDWGRCVTDFIPAMPSLSDLERFSRILFEYDNIESHCTKA